MILISVSVAVAAFVASLIRRYVPAMAPADTVIKPTCCTVATEEAATLVPIAVSSVATSAAVETVTPVTVAEAIAVPLTKPILSVPATKSVILSISVAVATEPTNKLAPAPVVK